MEIAIPVFAGLSVMILAAGLVIDAIFGDPDWLWRRIAHPIVLIGRFIGLLDRALNRPAGPRWLNRVAGVVAALLIAGLAWALGMALSYVSRTLPFGTIAETLLVGILLAQHGLIVHVRAVLSALRSDGLAGGRRAVARIVGRDPESLDHSGVCRAAVESLAENYSDGVVAPVFWYLLAGLPGLILYKAVNTADSMIGHRSARYLRFGWASARLDDVLNLIPARLTALLFVAATLLLFGPAAAGRALRTMRRDARHHRSPNAGWPEAAMAGALDIALAGPRSYDGKIVEDAWMNPAGRPVLLEDDISRALRITAFSGVLLVAGVVCAAFILMT